MRKIPGEPSDSNSIIIEIEENVDVRWPMYVDFEKIDIADKIIKCISNIGVNGGTVSICF